MGAALLFLLVSGCREPEVTAPVAVPAPHLPEMRGLAYTSFSAGGFRTGGARNALGQLRTETASNWVALTVFEYQSTPYTSDIAPNASGTNPLTGGPWSTSATPDDIRDGARQARSLGMKILLKPHVDLYTGQWRASILPDPGMKWFGAYETMMLKYADLASELHIEMLCIGTELVRATQPAYTPRWRDLIASVRQRYTGKLIYAANWNGDGDAGIGWPEYEQIGFWGDLDLVGIDAYYPLAGPPPQGDEEPSVPFCLVLLRDPLQALRAIAGRTGKKVILTEVGIQSAQGALARPWDYTIGARAGSVQDLRGQDYYYHVILNGFGAQEWCGGIFWWNWDTVPTSYEATDFTPRNKPAALTVRRWAGPLAP